ncbi:MAG: hypothetical protein M1825_001498 [Sarcosagium campestre]|nr:MAG: hypothetical protein M1825_001498 [Sarcosagium campestre]
MDPLDVETNELRSAAVKAFKEDLERNVNERFPAAVNAIEDHVARRLALGRKFPAKSIRKSTRLQEKENPHRPLRSQKQKHQPSAPTSKTLEEEVPRDSPASIGSSNPDRKRKRSAESDSIKEAKAGRKLPRLSAAGCTALKTSSQKAASDTGNSNSNVHLHHWIKEGSWPPEYFKPDGNMSHSLTRKRSSPSISNKQSEISGISLREGKNPVVKSRRYEQILASVGIHMDDDITVMATDASRSLCQTLLDTEQTVPQDSLFNDDLFRMVLEKVRNRNEARVMRDLSPLLIPSAEILHVRGATNLKHIIETVDEGWIKSIPLVPGPRPQPDFSVGLKQTAFTSEQLKKLRPFIGDWQETSRLVATDEMFFPFLTSEVKCGNEALNIADRQNAHNASVAVNAVVELYRAVSRQDELHQQILAFSISHDHRVVRIYGHFALTTGEDTRFYRHLINSFDIMALDGRNKWTTYKFTRNLYDTFVPIHLERICAVVDQLPDPEVFRVQSLSHKSSAENEDQDESQSTPAFSQESLPRLASSSQTTGPVFKRPKAK